MDDSNSKEFLDHFFNFIFLQRGGDMDGYLGEGFLGQEEWNDHEHHGKKGVPGEWNNHLMFIEDGLEVLQHRGCLSGLNGMELCNNARMTFFEHLFHVTGADDLRGTDSDALELILLSLLFELHG